MRLGPSPVEERGRLPILALLSSILHIMLLGVRASPVVPVGVQKQKVVDERMVF
jgi:hypothetical protein